MISCSFFAQDIAISTLKTLDTAGCNLSIAEVQGGNTYLLSNTSKAHNWFSGVFSGIGTASPTTFIIDMKDTGTPESPGDVKKWEGLWPVYTYAKYWDYNSYIYYTKNKEGYWVSSDPFLIEDAKLAGNGKTPIQNVIMDELADEFLSSDGAYWSAWAEIKNTRPNRDNTFQITKQFHSSDVSIAMKYPYNFDYEQEYMDRLENANISGVTVHKIGKSIRKHNLYVVEIRDPEATEEELRNKRVVLMYANEDGDEPDSSWVVDGAMSYLAQGLLHDDKQVKDILKDVTFLFIPLLDPVGWSNATYGAMAYDFSYNMEYNRFEVLSYIKFIINWCGIKERRLDVALNIHNIECNEGSNVLSPHIDDRYWEDAVALKKIILENLPDVKTGNDVWVTGFFYKRFSHWCTDHWGGVPVLFEVNSRYPEKRLYQKDMAGLGQDFALVFEKYFKSEEYERVLPIIEKKYAEQTNARNEYWSSQLSRRHGDDNTISDGF